MDVYKEAMRRIENHQLNSLEVYKLIEKDNNLSSLFYFVGDGVKYDKNEYARIKKLIK